MGRGEREREKGEGGNVRMGDGKNGKKRENRWRSLVMGVGAAY